MFTFVIRQQDKHNRFPCDETCAPADLQRGNGGGSLKHSQTDVHLQRKGRYVTSMVTNTHWLFLNLLFVTNFLNSRSLNLLLDARLTPGQLNSLESWTLGLLDSGHSP